MESRSLGPYGYGTGGPFGDGWTAPYGASPSQIEFLHTSWVQKRQRELYERQEQQSALDKQMSNANKQQNIQLGAIVGAPLIAAGGTALGKYGFDALTQTQADKIMAQVAEQNAMLELAKSNQALAALKGAGEASTAASGLSSAAGAVPDGMMAVGTAADGSTMFAPGLGGAGSGVIEEASTLGSLAPYAGLAGAALGGYGMFNANQKKDAMGGALSGAGAGLGLGMAAPLLIGGGPLAWTTLGGLALAGALAGGGLGAMGKIGDKDRFKDEYNRAQALRDQGINWNYNTEEPSVGRSIDELIAAEEAKKAAGQYSNVGFASSRDEGALQAQDLVGYAFLPELLGADYANAKQEDQLKAAEEALRLGVREHHGTIDYTGDEDSLREWYKNYLAGKK